MCKTRVAGGQLINNQIGTAGGLIASDIDLLLQIALPILAVSTSTAVKAHIS